MKTTTYTIKTVSCDETTLTVAAYWDDPRVPNSPFRVTRTYTWDATDGWTLPEDHDDRLPEALSLALDSQATYGDRGEDFTIEV